MLERPMALFYSPDSIGLGHMRRNSAIATALVEAVPFANALLLVGSGTGAVFDLPKGVDSIKLPSVLKTGAERWQSRTMTLSPNVAAKLRAGLIKETVATLRPDVFVVDHLPAGVWNELLPTLELIGASGGRMRAVLGLRDILDEPERICSRWQADGTYELIDRYYDHIFIYGQKSHYAAAEAYGLEARMPGKITYCGYVSAGARRQASKSGTINGVKAPDDGRKHIVVTAGGGFDAHPMMSACLGAITQIKSTWPLAATMVTGPLMPVANRERLETEAAGLPVELITWTNDLAGHFDQADLIITMGGYNSILETVSLGKPVINIPRTGPSQEQRMRARRFRELGLLDYVDLDDADRATLGTRIADALARPHAPAELFRTDGADVAARLIAEGFTKRWSAAGAARRIERVRTMGELRAAS